MLRKLLGYERCEGGVDENIYLAWKFILYQIAAQIVAFVVGALGTVFRNIYASQDALEIPEIIGNCTEESVVTSFSIYIAAACLAETVSVDEDIK